ncbi:MAG: MFS transporter [Tannerellaceae bacterium]|nr:MFS transporter [Tannerellaceae bacterium]
MNQTNTPSSINYTILFIICMASSLVPFTGSALNLALPYINQSLDLDVVTSGWIPTAYILSTAIFQVPFARIADMVGRKKIFLTGVLIFTLFSLLSGLAQSGLSLIIYRFLAGTGSAMMFGTSIAILTASMPAHKRGQVLGINTAVVYASLAAGPLLGGLLTQYLDWQSIFFVSAGIGLIVYIGAWIAIKEEWKEEKKTSFDTIGACLYALGLLALIYGFTELPSAKSLLLILTGSLLLTGFAYYEKRHTHPVFNIELFLHNRIFKLSSLSALINYSATSAIAFMLSLYLQYVRGLTPQEAGLILIAQSVIQSVISVISGRLSDKTSPTLLATSGMAIIAVGLIGLCFLQEDTSYIYLVSLLIILGIGFGTFSSPNTNIIMSSVEKKDYSMASATTGTMRLTGQAFSMGIAIMAISIYVGNIRISAEVHEQLISSMRMIFSICSGLCLVGIYFSSVRKRKK